MRQPGYDQGILKLLRRRGEAESRRLVGDRPYRRLRWSHCDIVAGTSLRVTTGLARFPSNPFCQVQVLLGVDLRSIRPRVSQRRLGSFKPISSANLSGSTVADLERVPVWDLFLSASVLVCLLNAVDDGPVVGGRIVMVASRLKFRWQRRRNCLW